jgi:dihydropteroate synthase
MRYRAEDTFEKHRLAVMGILNVTPDSFSDGGDLFRRDVAVERACAFFDAGVEIIDVGGESTRPGSLGVSLEDERERVIPVIEEILEKRPEAIISVDTSKTAVARAALERGASIVNDVTAGAEEGMFEVVAEHGAGLVLMHMRGQPRTMQKNTTYDDVVVEVRAKLLRRAEIAVSGGVAESSIFLDPGIGFGKDLEGNLALLRALPQLAAAGFPLVVGTSRKSFLGAITGADVKDRLSATLASLIPTLALERVVLRVHDAEEVLRFRAVLEALRVGVSTITFEERD